MDLKIGKKCFRLNNYFSMRQIEKYLRTKVVQNWHFYV